MSRRFWLPLFALVAALAFAGLACDASGPSAPCEVKTSKEASDRLIQRIKDTVEGKKTGDEVTLNMTNEEFSSLISESIKEAEANNPDANTTKMDAPIVCFQGGKLKLFATIKGDNNSSVNLLVEMTPSVKDGALALTVDNIQLGPIPAPEEMRTQMSTEMSKSMGDAFSTLDLSEVKITDGEMTITGKIK